MPLSVSPDDQAKAEQAFVNLVALSKNYYFPSVSLGIIKQYLMDIVDAPLDGDRAAANRDNDGRSPS